MAPAWLKNPFFTLAISPKASAAEVERAGQLLSSKLAAGSEAIKTYSVLGHRFERDDFEIKWALSELRDPEKRLLWEFLFFEPRPPKARHQNALDFAKVLGF
ncbi:MAG: hypothetical protein H6510_02635 [Acidobacteria bacterium]|nr:hypothetical protein [Acidobacteriota bacterium]MCB9396692.1 hypothetical protein [Acidobacteriota bacterium]